MGAWRLVSFEYRNADGEVSYLYGRDPAGYLICTENGYMSVAFGSVHRRRLPSEDLTGGSVEEKARAYDTCFSYFGTYEVVDERVIHHVEVSLNPDWAGTDLERTVEFAVNQLRLVAPPMLIGGQQRMAIITWERVE